MDAESRYAAYNEFVWNTTDRTIPHCDSRILHHPDDCKYCDRPHWQAMRAATGVAHTGRVPLPGQVPCEADVDRPPRAENDHRKWGGNRPTTSLGDPLWPEETLSSLVLYGDPGTRTATPPPPPLTPPKRSRFRLFGRTK